MQPTYHSQGGQSNEKKVRVRRCMSHTRVGHETKGVRVCVYSGVYLPLFGEPDVAMSAVPLSPEYVLYNNTFQVESQEVV